MRRSCSDRHLKFITTGYRHVYTSVWQRFYSFRLSLTVEVEPCSLFIELDKGRTSKVDQQSPRVLRSRFEHLSHFIVDSLVFSWLSNVSLAPVLCSMMILRFAFAVTSRMTIAVISTNLPRKGVSDCSKRERSRSPSLVVISRCV